MRLPTPKVIKVLSRNDPLLHRVRHNVFDHLPPLRRSVQTPNHYFKHYPTLSQIPTEITQILARIPNLPVSNVSAQRVESHAQGPPVVVPIVKGCAVFCVSRENIHGGMTLLQSIDPSRLSISEEYRLEVSPGEVLLLDDVSDLYKITPIQAMDCDFPGYRDVLVIS